jgi:hypothetical protein
MGFQSTLLIRNDCLHEIAADKDFGTKVSDAVSQGWGHFPVDISSGHCGNASTVVESHHSDGMVALVAGGGTISRLGYKGDYPTDPQSIKDLKTLLNNVCAEYGLRVIKTKKVRS